jgi:hypothetical protein
MKKQSTILIILTAIVYSSCTVMGSLYPLSENEGEYIFKEEFIGKWSNTKSTNEIYDVDTVSGSRGKFYRIEILNRRTENRSIVDTIFLTGILIQSGNWYFLDCKINPEKMLVNKKETEDLLILKHIILKLFFKGKDNIEALTPDPDKLIKLIDAGKIKLDYSEIKKEDYLIYSKTTALKKAVEELNKYPDVYESVIELVRLK